MSDFAPSVEAAKKALGNAITIETKDHPPGAKGVALSLDEVAARVRKGRNDPRVRAWAIRSIKDANVGGPNRSVEKAQAILSALRKATVYVLDPLNTEFIQAAHETLCLDDKGLCFKGGDCFARGTKVLRERHGDEPEVIGVEELRVGDRIWGHASWTRVEAWVAKGALPVDSIALSAGPMLHLTHDHHVFVRERGPLPVDPCRSEVVSPASWHFSDAPISWAQRSSDSATDKGSTDGGFVAPRFRVSELRIGDRLLQPPPVVLSFLTGEDDPAIGVSVRGFERASAVVECFDIQTTDHYVYLPEHRVVVSQCDDLTVAYGAAVLSVGIPFKVIGQAFKDAKIPQHVMGAIQDTETKEWFKVDPSTDKPVGEYVIASEEWWIDPLDEKDATTQRIAGTGDFIGVGTLGMLGATIPEPTQNVVIQQIQSALYDLQTSVTGLGAALDQVAQITSVSGFDPEPSFTIEGISDFPSTGIWTPTMDTVARQFLTQVQYLEAVGQDALNGVRTIYLDASNNVLIQQLAIDTVSWNPIVQTGTDLIIAIYNKAGSLLGGITAQLGEYLNPTEVEAKAPGAATNTVQGLGVVPVAVWVLGGVAVVVDALVVWAVMSKLADTVATIAREKSRQTLIAFYEKCVSDGTCTAAQATEALNKNQQLMNEAAKQDAANNPFNSALDSFTKLLKWVAIGGLVVVGGYVAYPVLRELSIGAADKLKTKRLARGDE